MENAAQSDCPAVKRRAACEECRVRKLKCSGEQPACARCQKEGIQCVYSLQKPMGRPKKRRKSLGDGSEACVDLAAQPQDLSAWTNLDIDGHAGLWDASVLNTTDLNVQDLDVNSPNIAFCGMDAMRRFAAPDLSSETSLQSDALDQTSFVSTNLDSSLQSTPLLAPNPPCACLSTMYLTLSSLATMETNADFPYALHPLRQAVHATSSILTCEECPKQFFSGMQNTSAMNSLLAGITERYSKVLRNITHEAERAAAAGETKKFRFADLQSSDSHLHGDALPHMDSFVITLSPSEWRSMCKKVVKAEIFGPSDGNNCCPYLVGLMDQMEHRQRTWHADRRFLAGNDACGASLPVPHQGASLDNDSDKLCLRQIAFAREMLSHCDWS